MRRRLSITVLVIVALGWGEAFAQSRGDIELGLDGGVGMVFFEEGTVTTIGFPFQNLRVGWFAGDRVEIEPSVAFQWFSSRSGSSLEEQGAGGAELAIAYHGGGRGDQGRVFVKAGGLALFAGDIDTQFGVEAALGWKQRFDSHWGLRFELSAGRAIESAPLAGGWLAGLAIGFSHFSKPR